MNRKNWSRIIAYILVLLMTFSIAPVQTFAVDVYDYGESYEDAESTGHDHDHDHDHAVEETDITEPSENPAENPENPAENPGNTDTSDETDGDKPAENPDITEPSDNPAENPENSAENPGNTDTSDETDGDKPTDGTDITEPSDNPTGNPENPAENPETPTENPENPELTEDAAAVLADMSAVLTLCGVTANMTDEEMAEAVIALGDEAYFELAINMEDINDRFSALSDTEIAVLEADETMQTYAQFYTVVTEMYGVETLAGGSQTIGGVSFANDNNSVSLNGSTVTTSNSAGSSPKEDTFTIKNNNQYDVKLSFSYALTGDIGSSDLSAFGSANSGSYAGTLTAGGSISVKFKPSKGSIFSRKTATLTLTGVSVANANATFTLTPIFNENLGTVTVNGNAAESGTAVSNLTTGVKLTATLTGSGAKFVAWTAPDGKIISTNSTYTLNSETDVTIHAVFASPTAAAWWKNTDNTYLYNDLNTALSKHNTVVLAADGTLMEGDYNVSGGKTLLIPFDDANTLYTTVPEHVKNTDGDTFLGFESGNKYTWQSSGGVSIFRTLRMASGANLKIDGAMSLSAKCFHAAGGQAGAGAPAGPLSIVDMEKGSSITVNNGASLYAWGYITGEGSVEAKSGAKIYESFQFNDFRGGDATNGMIGNTNKVFPMSQYYIQNIQAPLTLNAGATESAYTGIFAAKMSTDATISFIGADGAMFTLSEGYAVKRYDSSTDRLILDVYGSLSINGMKMKLGTYNINSSDYVLPINSNITINICKIKGANTVSTVTVGQNIALLPGARINIENGARCNITGSNAIYVYDSDNWNGYSGPGNKKLIPILYAAPKKLYSRAEKDLTDAAIVVAGLLDASEGYIYTTSGGADICGIEGGQIKLMKGKETVTYQATQTGTDISYADIPITSAKLKNGNGTYVETSGTDTAAAYNYVNAKWVLEHEHSYKEEITRQATCTKAGEKKYTCTICGDSYTTDIAVIPHSGGTATCTAKAVCDACGNEYGEINPANHSGKAEWIQTATTHEEKYNCCGATKTSEAKHSWSNGACTVCGYGCQHSGGSASCTEKAICEVCGQGYGELAAHKMPSAWTTSKPATCTEKGEQYRVCEVCGGNKETKEIPADGHILNQKTEARDATCTANGNNEYWVCQRCKAVFKADKTTETTIEAETIKAKGHTMTHHSAVDATCTAGGSIEYWACSVCGKNYSDEAGANEVENIKTAMKAHTLTKTEAKDATCTADGNSEYWKCSVCGQLFSDSAGTNSTSRDNITISKLGHKMIKTEAKDADCTTDGTNGYYTCLQCNNVYKDAAGAAATTVEAEKLTALGHSLLKHDAKEATCTASGNNAYWTCSRCGKVFADADGKTETTVEKETIKATGHMMSKVEGNAATCTTDGNPEYYFCSLCEKNYQDKDGNAEFTGNTVIPATGHRMTEVEAKAAACTTDGNNAYWICSNCDKVFKDADGKTETTVAEETIGMQGHNYGPASYSWEENGLACTATHTCTRKGCGHSETARAKVTGEVTKVATCTNKGDTTYTAVFTFAEGDNVWATEQKKTITSNIAVDPENHTSTDYKYVKNEDGTHDKLHACCNALAAREGHTYTNGKCVCEAVQSFTITWISGNTTKTTTVNYGETPVYSFDTPTIDANRQYHYTFAGWSADEGGQALAVIPEATANVTYYVVFNAVSHTVPENSHDCSVCGYKNVTDHNYNNATCTTAATCSICGGTKGDPMGHDYTYNASKSAWSYDDTTGAWTYTAVATCNREGVCNSTVQESVTASLTSVIREAACTETGLATYTAVGFKADWAKDLSISDNKSLPALGHDLVKTDAKASTCTIQGNTEYWTCSRCSNVYEDENATKVTSAAAMKLPLAAHTWNVGTITTAATCTTDGIKTFSCEVCGSTKTEKVNAMGHDMQDVAEIPATCEESGVSAHKKCSRCDHTENRDILPAIGHTYGAVTFAWDLPNQSQTGAAACTASHTCTVCKKAETATAANVVDKVTTYPTCTAEGVRTYTATFADEWVMRYTGSNTARTNEPIPEKGHTYTVDYTWTVKDGVASCTAKRSCSECKFSETADAAKINSNTTVATCTAEGKIVYTVESFDVSWAEADAAGDHTVILNKLDHNWILDSRTEATCEDNGSISYKCSECDATRTETLAAEGHKWTAATTKPATCTENGEAEYRQCTVCGKEEHGATIKALGHKWTVTYTWSGDKTSCTANAVCGREGCNATDAEAVSATVDVLDASCTATGMRTFTAQFTKEWAQTQTETEIIAKKNHSFVNKIAGAKKSDATCDSAEIWYVKCDNCDYVSDTETVTVGEKREHDWQISYNWAADHSSCTATRTCGYNDCKASENAVGDIDSSTVDATCTATGKTTYTAVFAEDWASTQTAEVTLDKLGHDYENAEVTYTWADNGSACVAERTCMREGCRNKQTATGTISKAVTTPATCEVGGETTYTATFSCDWATTQTKSIADIDALGHNYSNDIEYIWNPDEATGEWSCVASRSCINSGCSDKQTALATISKKVTTASTCTVMGKTTYTAAFDVTWAIAQTKTEQDVELAAHTEDSGIITKSPFYADKGERTYSCKDCGAFIRNEEIQATGVLNISVLGDSITAFADYSNGNAALTANTTLAGGLVWFPMTTQTSEWEPVEKVGEIQAAEHIWIYKAAEELNANVLVNNSWSGSAVQFYQYGADGMWEDRCVQLHDNIGDNAGQEPDIIAVYMGTNDFKHVEGVHNEPPVDENGDLITPVLGSYEAVDFDTLITENADGSFTYAEPQNTMEAYAVSFHKMQQRYPNSEIYVMTLLPFKANKQQPTDFNADIRRMAAHFNVTLVDLENTGIESDAKSFEYLMEDWLHPNLKGMEVLSNAFVSALRHNSSLVSDSYVDVSYDLNGVVSLEGTTRTALTGERFESNLKLKDDTKPLFVTVTMGGQDITGSCYTAATNDRYGDIGKVVIENVTGAISISANAHEHSYTAVVTPATCNEGGYTTYTCNDASCGHSYIGNQTGALGHSFTTKASEQLAAAATCTTAASYYVRCDRCENVSDKVTIAVGSAKGHSYTDKASDQLATAATCTAAATYYVQCDNCSEVSSSLTVSIGEPAEHSFTTKASDKIKENAACTAAAIYWVQCDNCSAVSDEIFVSVGSGLGHSYAKKQASDTLVSDADCENAAVYYVKCDRCGAINPDMTVSVGNKLGHSFTAKASDQLAAAATCTAAASYYVQCDRCDTVAQNKTVFVGSANGHSFGEKASGNCRSAATCTEAATYWVQCDNCTEVSNEKYVFAGKPNGHSFTTKASNRIKDEATCTEAATYWVQCDNCDVISETESVKSGSAKGHAYGEATYDWSADGSSCTAKRICETDASHVETAKATITSVVVKPADCESMGDTEYTAVFSVAWAEEQTLTVTDINATGHSYGETTYVWNEDFTRCEAKHTCVNGDCKHFETTVSTRIDESEKKKPGCTEPGEKEYTAYFSVSWAANCKETVETAAIGHTYGQVSYEWSADYTTCTAKHSCSRCKAQETAFAQISSVTEPATCTAAGHTVYTATFAEEWAPDDTKTEVIEKLDHEYGETAYLWTQEDDKWICTATHTCVLCSETQSANGAVTSEQTKKPACTTPGETTYTATFYASWVKEKTQIHTLADIAATGHTEVADLARESTCSATGLTAGSHCRICGEVIVAQKEIEKKPHTLIHYEGRKPTYTEVGYEAYDTCEYCEYTTYQSIPALGEPSVTSYAEFIEALPYLEKWAEEYASVNAGKDAVDLVIKYIRTGVERYNSGSWGIMAGYEDKAFAEYVRSRENAVNADIDNVDDYLKVTGLKNIENFYLPNGNEADFGHMFGTMDISYNNKGSVDHADVGGWAGDLVDLMTASDRAYNNSPESTVHFEIPDNLETMVEQIGSEIFMKITCEDDKFSETDFYGDMDALYVIQTLYRTNYQAGDMADIISGWCTANLDDTARAEFFVSNRLGSSGTRAQMREMIYNEFTANKTIVTLEGTRDFLNTDSAYMNQLRKASCYAFADYICRLAGDYIDVENNPYYTDFDSELTTLAPGITQDIRKATTADNKQMVYYLATADLSNPYVDIYANYNNCNPTEWRMTRVLDQAQAAQNKYGDPQSKDYILNYQVVAAINSDGFNMSTGEPSGLLIMDGTEYHSINSNGFFGITKSGKALIGTTEEYNTTWRGRLAEAVGGFGTMLVVNGKIAVSPDNSYYNNRASRTAVGITRTGKVVFMVLDGRQEPVSCGGSFQEIAQIMLEAGCVNALNLDGGGSTTFVSKPEGSDDLQVTNKPSDGYARSVSSTLMMVSTAPSSTAFDHARLDSEYDYVTVGSSVQITASGVSATGNEADLPEGCTWTVSDETLGSITEDGIFTGNALGDVNVSLIHEGTEIGSTTIHVVIPTQLYFTRSNINAIYGTTVDMPIAALYNGKDVALNEGDVVFTVTPAGVGECSGFRFTAAAESEYKVATVNAALSMDSKVTATLTVSLYKPGEATFDFDTATGGDRQLAWLREVSNTVTDDEQTYTVIDRDKSTVVSYIFAMDMTQIPIPEALDDLIYMLPGADASNASAWNFLLQLAERVSVLTEVRPVFKIDPRFDVDYSELRIVTEYFELNKDKSVYDEETNTLTLVLNWKKQTQPIDAATADPLCMVSGLKLTPKDGFFGNGERVTVSNNVNISYKIYLRANALYTFAQKPESQEKYGLYPFVNPDNENEKGGYLSSDYTNMTDMFTISRAQKQGWVREGEGYAYYINGEKLTGIDQAEGYYYDFGDDGINIGQTRYTGLFDDANGKHYALVGKIATSGWYLVNGTMYHCHSNGCAYTSDVSGLGTCVKGGRMTYTCSDCSEKQVASDYTMPNGHDWNEDHVCRVCGFRGIDINTAKRIAFGKVDNPRTSTSIPSYYYLSGGVRPSSHVTFDGKTALTWSNDANLNPDGTMRDLYISWTNNRGIGKAYVEMTGKGNYYGTCRLEYHIIPNDVTNLKATANEDGSSVTLSWSAAAGANYYRIYSYNNGSRKFIANADGTEYTVTGLTGGKTYSFQVASSAYSTDGENKVYNCAKWSNTATATLKSDGTGGGGSGSGGSGGGGGGSGTVENPDDGKEETPSKDVSHGRVAVIVGDDGIQHVIRTAVVAEDDTVLGAKGMQQIKIVEMHKHFNDTENHWSRDEVCFVAVRELFIGIGDNIFGTQLNTTRGTICTVLARLEGVNTEGGEIWYDKGVQWGMENGITDGTNPEAPITREQLAAMLYRYAGSPEVSGRLSFEDTENISVWAEDAVLWATQNGILKGFDDGCMYPQAYAERAQVAAMFARFIEYMAK